MSEWPVSGLYTSVDKVEWLLTRIINFLDSKTFVFIFVSSIQIFFESQFLANQQRNDFLNPLTSETLKSVESERVESDRVASESIETHQDKSNEVESLNSFPNSSRVVDGQKNQNFVFYPGPVQRGQQAVYSRFWAIINIGSAEK